MTDGNLRCPLLSAGGPNQSSGGFLFFGRLEIQEPRPDHDDDPDDLFKPAPLTALANAGFTRAGIRSRISSLDL